MFTRALRRLAGRAFSPSVRTRATQSTSSFLTGTSGLYVEEMFSRWKANPAAVHASWDAYFRTGQFQAPPGLAGGVVEQQDEASPAASPGTMVDYRVLLLARAYAVSGHAIANLDPLGLFDADLDSTTPPELELEAYGFTEADLDREFYVGTDQLSGFLGKEVEHITLRTFLKRLKETYCDTIGYEYMHIIDRATCNWIRERIETPEQTQISKEEKLVLLDRLMFADRFEAYLKKKFSNTKRFGVEGCEVLIPAMKFLIDESVELGVEDVVIGMPHRGRLNVLVNVVRKPLEEVFAEFSGGHDNDANQVEGSGDVKYHLGMSYDRPTRSGKTVHLSLVANPSHLEAVNPVVTGKVYAKQFRKEDGKKKVVPILLHGDAAFAGQGVVYETMGFAGLENYSVGGTIHMVVNNQIGFTTDPQYSRSTAYCTDLAKMLQAPIFHVNGNDPEAVIRVSKLAAEFRQTFQRDVVIDIVCYRRHGHNETDEPKFTQPLMYNAIEKMTPVVDIYSKKLVSEGTCDEKHVGELDNLTQSVFDEAFKKSAEPGQRPGLWLESHWKGFKGRYEYSTVRDTGVPDDVLKRVGTALTTVPDELALHRGVKRLFDKRRKMIDSGSNIDWATAEALAFGSLLAEGMDVRLSGQDVERGTFSQRHHVVHDQNTNGTYVPLQHIPDAAGQYTVCNSHLSEFGVLGFEAGYAMEIPDQLVLWEAQFGDFANGAQVIFDQFLSSGEDKWLRQCGLVCLLPHGYDGQGPEHSSARLERFLQACNDDPTVIPDMGVNSRLQIQQTNWQVLNCTTPANYFHALRRQVHRDFRKPLIVMGPKSLLRDPDCVSTFADMTEGKRLRRVIEDDGSALEKKPDGVRRLVFCSGKVYYDLFRHRNENKIGDVAISRIEQIAPFPFDKVAAELKKYPNAEVVWVQEEPRNMGAWSYIAPRVHTCVRSLGRQADVQYVGRAPSASTAAGNARQHNVEQAALVNGAFAEA